MKKDVIERNKTKAKYNNESWLGKKFGTLTIIGIEHKDTYWKWICRCDCGTEKSYLPQKLRNGTTKTCGCGKIARCKEYTIEYRTKHGGRHERLYHIWRGMKERCHNPKNKDYGNYGEKGVKVCEEWLNDYAAFREWAILNGYADNLTIDRINPHGHYEPLNCRWLVLEMQNRNKRNTIKIKLNGELVPLVDICEQRGLKYGTVYARIFRYGVQPERALY